MKSSIQKVYEAPQAEIIAIESQSVLCASGGGNSTQSYNFSNNAIDI